MPRRKRKPNITPGYLLDRIDYQLYAASLSLKRLKISLEPDSEDFNVDVAKELRELGQRCQIVLKRIKQLKAMPKTAWK